MCQFKHAIILIKLINERIWWDSEIRGRDKDKKNNFLTNKIQLGKISVCILWGIISMCPRMNIVF